MNINLFQSCGLPTSTAEAGHVLQMEGERVAKVYVLISGKLEIRHRGRILTTTDSPGIIVGQVAKLLDSAAVPTVTVLEPSTFYVIDDFISFLELHPEVGVAVAQRLASQLVATVSHFVQVREQLGAMQRTMSHYVSGDDPHPETE